jgi:hypothetical protein
MDIVVPLETEHTGVFLELKLITCLSNTFQARMWTSLISSNLKAVLVVELIHGAIGCLRVVCITELFEFL